MDNQCSGMKNEPPRKFVRIVEKATKGREKMNEICDMYLRGEEFTCEPREVSGLVMIIMHYILYASGIRYQFEAIDGAEFYEENDYLEFAKHAQECFELDESELPTDIIMDIIRIKYPVDPNKACKFFDICMDIVVNEIREVYP